MSRPSNLSKSTPLSTGKEMIWWLPDAAADEEPASERSDSERVSLIWPKASGAAPPAGTHTPREEFHTRDSYWFAHGGGEVGVPALQAQPTLDRASDSGFSEGKETSPPLTQREREERVKQLRTQQEQERRRRLEELQQASLQAQRNREVLEEERRRKVEELRQREMERRQAVEERKRQIWEAEKERKEAIVRRNLEREARIEARRNAQRNSMCFAFGSSTPRTFDLELAALGGSSILLSSASSTPKKMEDVVDSRRDSREALDLDSQLPASSWERKYPSGMRSDEARACLTFLEASPPPPNNTSPTTPLPAWGFLSGSGAQVIGEDLMTQSATALLGGISRARRKTDLVPTIPWEGRGSSRTRSPASTPVHPPRAVSMTRLDQLAQPRRRYIEHLKNPRLSTVSPSMTKSMMSIPSARPKPFSRKPPNMSQSMCSPLSTSPEPPPRKLSLASSTSLKSFSKSMVHLAPRPTRASQLRSDLSLREGVPRNTGATKDNLRPPSRPRSSMSQASEMSTSSLSVTLRNKGALGQRRGPRPLTIAGPLTPEHTPDKKVQPPPPQKVTSPPDDTKQVKPTPPPKPTTLRKPPQATSTPVVKQKQPSPPKEEPPQAPMGDGAAEEAAAAPAAERAPSPPTQEGTRRIISEEEAKAALAEKRRLAREQAEREAEEARRREEEARRKQEEEEAEQKRLAEEARKAEEERLQRAIEEQQAREREEQQRLEEEARLRAEKEEQDRLAKEEAERQRKELEEKLRREEAARAERKKRVEQIMSRTRGRGSSTLAQSALGINSSTEEQQSPATDLLSLQNGHDEDNRTTHHTNGFHSETNGSSQPMDSHALNNNNTLVVVDGETAPPLIAFEDALIKKSDPAPLVDLLS